MAVNDTLTLLLAGFAGASLGAIFFGGLWWTTRKGLSSSSPALWFLGSVVLRTAIVLAGLYFVGGGQWQRLVAALVGFTVARFVVMWLTRPARGNHKQATQVARHAP